MQSLNEKPSMEMGNKNRPLFIAFGEHQVAVLSNTHQVLMEISRGFREMLTPDVKKLVGELEVIKKNQVYYLFGSSEECIESRTLHDVLNHLNYQIVLCLIQSNYHLLWLHAAGATKEGKGVIISGLSGRGKSTIATNLCSFGWTYLSDDVLPLDMNSGDIHPFPRLPTIRADLGQELPLEEFQKLGKTEVHLRPEKIHRKPVAIRAIVLPIYNPTSPTTISPSSPATAAQEILQNCLNFVHHKQYAVKYVCEMVKRVPTFHLSYGDSQYASKLITKLFESTK